MMHRKSLSKETHGLWTVSTFVKQVRRIIKITKRDDLNILPQQPEGIDPGT